jgi:hypothetical protein
MELLISMTQRANTGRKRMIDSDCENRCATSRSRAKRKKANCDSARLRQRRVAVHCLGIVKVAVNFHNVCARRRWSVSATSRDSQALVGGCRGVAYT